MKHYEGKVNPNQLKALKKKGFNPATIKQDNGEYLKNGKYLVAIVLKTGSTLEDAHLFAKQLKEMKTMMPKYIQLVSKVKVIE